MPELQLTTAAANALGGTTDPSGVVYPNLNVNNWGAAELAEMYQACRSFILANQLRVYPIQGTANAVGVYGGTKRLGNATLTLAQTEPAVSSLTNNAVTYVWLYSSSGTATIGYAVSGTGWPTYPHFKLAEVTMASGVITAILDHRGEGVSDQVTPSYSTSGRPAASTVGRMIFNTTTSKPNWDTGSGWVNADGTTA